MPPLVVDVMSAHRNALLRQEEAQMRAMANRWLQVENALQTDVLRFVERVAEDGLTPAQIRSRQFQLDRFQSLLVQVRRELDKYTNYTEPLITNRQRELAEVGINHATEAIRNVAGTTIAFDVLPVSATENMAGLASDDSPLRNLLVASYGDAAEGMFNHLIAGVASGKHPTTVARSMIRDGLSQSLNRMMVIARTEQLRVYREASRQAYQRSGVVQWYKRLAAKSSRTCIACLLADGQIYNTDVIMDTHPCCRCAMIPVVNGYLPTAWQEGPEWFMAQSAATQRSILGPGRYEGWWSGHFRLEDMITQREDPIWGNSLQPASLRSLLNGTVRPFVVRRAPVDAN